MLSFLLILGVFCVQGVKVYNRTVINKDGKVFKSRFDANEPTLCDPLVQQYSGYFSADGKNEYFYWFFESRNSPSTSPLIMWLTGGPGCSSILALLVENGPCYVNDDATNTYNNPHSWNTNSNIMWVDQPPGTGFSTGTEVTNEKEIQEDMWAFLQNFIKAFPQYFKNGFYVVGESYGGHYVPNVVSEIYNQNTANAGTYIPLKGFAVGNGLTDPYIQFNYYVEMAYNSSTAINSPYPKIPISSLLAATMSAQIPKCQEEISKCNVNDATTLCDDAYNFCLTSQVEPVTITGVNPYNLDIECEIPGLCYNFTAQGIWLNNATVQKQIGVNRKWESCSNSVNARLQSDWMIDYQDLLPPLLENGIRGLIYAGDLDFICNWLGNQAWSLNLDWTGKEAFNNAGMKPWYTNNKKTGELRTANGFSFLRVYEAGHMVPMDQPAAALNLIDEFINNSL